MGLTPYPPLLEERGDKSPFLAHFQEISQARNWGEKGNFSPPLLKERGLGGEAQITVYLSVLRTLEDHLATKVEGLVVRDASEETEVEKVSAYAVT